MLAFARVLRRGDSVVDIGGHIGYVSLYLSELVGEEGKVFVFEPGANNLPYIGKNLEQVGNALLVEKAVSSSGAKAALYVEDIAGQTDSVVHDYHFLVQDREWPFSRATPE
jgi:FkbM family methyltransferase